MVSVIRGMFLTTCQATEIIISNGFKGPKFGSFFEFFFLPGLGSGPSYINFDGT